MEFKESYHSYILSVILCDDYMPLLKPPTFINYFIECMDMSNSIFLTCTYSVWVGTGVLKLIRFLNCSHRVFTASTSLVGACCAMVLQILTISYSCASWKYGMKTVNDIYVILVVIFVFFYTAILSAFITQITSDHKFEYITFEFTHLCKYVLPVS